MSAAAIIRRRRSRRDRRAESNRSRAIWTIVFSALILIGGVLPVSILGGTAALVYADAVRGLPAPRGDLGSLPATEFLDRGGVTVIDTLRLPTGDGWVLLETLPNHVVRATLIAEDPDYLTRSPRGTAATLLRLWNALLGGTTTPDPSISGRLARSVVLPLTAGGTLGDAATREIAVIAEIERRYDRGDLLEWHLNTNDYGADAFGIEAAAQTYFAKRAVDLTLDEAAMLAAIPTAPQYSPLRSETAARARQADLLRAMRDADAITVAQYDAALAVRTPLRQGALASALAPEFTRYARRQAELILNDLGYDGARQIALGGLRITTSLDVELQAQATCTLGVRVSGIADPDCTAAAFLPPTADAPRRADAEGAIVILDARSGAVRVLVGDAVGSTYQPGATLQPFIYLAAFLNGQRTPATMVYDIPLQFPGAEAGLIYSVSSPDGRHRGALSLREAMASWRLPPAIDIAYQLGMTSIIRTAHQLGITSLDETRYDIMLLERGGGVSVLDMTYAYSVFAGLGSSRGVPVEPLRRDFRGRDPVAILRIVDAEGRILWTYDETAAARCASLTVCTPLLEDSLAYLVNDILADQEARWATLGQGTVFDTPRPAAVVAGAAGGDGWTIGYTPQYAIGAVIRDESGAVDADAAAVWRALLEYTHARDGIAASGWARPEGLVETGVCAISGLLPNGVCPVVPMLLIDGTQPRTTDPHWRMVEINDQTRQLATVNTPSELRSEARFFVPPSGAITDWWVANRQPLPPTEYDNVSRPQIFQTARLTRPALFQYVGGTVEVYADVLTTDMQYFQVEYGAGLNPTEWINLGGRQTTYTPDRPIARWDTSALDGLYSLRLIVVANDNSRDSDAIQVTIDNQPPTVRLRSVEEGKVYRWPQDPQVQLEAVVEDNLTIDRVEFYWGDVPLGADMSWPFVLEWEISELGSQTFTAIAFDGVGNQSGAQITVEILRAGS